MGDRSGAVEAEGTAGADGDDRRRGAGGERRADAGGVPQSAGRPAHHGRERRRGARRAIATMALGTSAAFFTGFTVVVAAFLGAFVAAALVVAVSARFRSVTTLLVFGVMLGFIFSALSSVLQYTAGEESLKLFYSWMAGSFSGCRYVEVALMAGALLIGLMLAFVNGKGLDIILFGEEYATLSGASTRRILVLSMLSCCLMTGTVTAFCGPLGFVGIVAPHLAPG